jgi:hypothetical protein
VWSYDATALAVADVARVEVRRLHAGRTALAIGGTVLTVGIAVGVAFASQYSHSGLR